MVALRVEERDDEVVFVLDEEARALFSAQNGDVFEVTAEGDKISLSKQANPDERFERGKAFLERYRKTFEALAK
ncbi:MAG: hypothetical protein J7521_01700 [Caulobacter sp.]|nr:hypothetical protein [Caulobacter sp.]